MVIRDLTLRSAASFGSFHLIRLLYDEYMFFLIEHKVARATGRTPIAVMSEVRLLVPAQTRARSLELLDCSSHKCAFPKSNHELEMVYIQ